MYADPTGLLWLGTSGGGVDKLDLDGKAFRHYRSIPGDPNSLNSNDVMGIYEDREGVLWIGTGSGGLNQVDRQSGQSTHYVYDPGDPHSLSDNMVREIVQDEEGKFWLPTRGGLNHFDPQAEQFTAYRHDPADPSGLLNDNVMTAYQGQNDVLWIGTWTGLNRLDPRTGEMVAYPGDSNNLDSLRGVTVISIYEERAGVLWLGTFGDGLIRFDSQAGRVAHYRHDDDPHSLASNSLTMVKKTDCPRPMWPVSWRMISRLNKGGQIFGSARQKACPGLIPRRGPSETMTRATGCRVMILCGVRLSRATTVNYSSVAPMG
jgi:hypothetical protein